MAFNRCRRCGQDPEVRSSAMAGFFDGERYWRVKCRCRNLTMKTNHFELVEDEWNYEVNKDA